MELHNYSLSKLVADSEDIMNTTAAGNLFVIWATAMGPAFRATCQAAAAAMPWDYTLIALQDMLITYIAPAAIGIALSGSIVLYALGDRDGRAGQLFGSALGGCIALGIVYLLNYVLP